MAVDDIQPDPVPVITLDDLTTVDKAEGTGTYDVLMRAAKEHIVDEYTQGRIQGAEYSTVYLGALQQTMQQSIAFLLAKDKTSYELQLLQFQADLLELQKEELAAKVVLIEAQVEKIQVEVELAELQKCVVAAECDQVKAQTCKLNAEYDLIIINKSKITQETKVMENQYSKLEQEIELLAQKKITEVAQTDGSVVSYDSVLGVQNALYATQKEGFLRKAEQEAASIMTATWNTRKMTDETGTEAAGAGLGDDQIEKVIRKLKSGIGAT